jgi:hypothetical protein
VPKHIKLNKEQQDVLKAMNSGESIFLTGNAGREKSTVGVYEGATAQGHSFLMRDREKHQEEENHLTPAPELFSDADIRERRPLRWGRGKAVSGDDGRDQKNS